MTLDDLDGHHSDLASIIEDCERVKQGLDAIAIETSTPYLHTAAHWVGCSIATLKGATHAIEQSESNKHEEA